MTKRDCIWCDATVDTDDATAIPFGGTAVTCACGVKYSTELLDLLDPDEWQRIKNRTGYEVDRDGAQLIITDMTPRAEVSQ